MYSYLRYKYLPEQKRDAHTKRPEPKSQNSQRLTWYPHSVSETVPFQNVSLLSPSLSSRAAPTHSDLWEIGEGR